MLYRTYQLQDDLVAPLRALARNFDVKSQWDFGIGSFFRRRTAAALEMVSRFELSHTRPDFGITSVKVGNRDVPVEIETTLDLPFGKLLRFA